MKKIFRMANAEISKIFMRPSMFLLTGVLIIALVFSFFFFSPVQNNTKHTYPLTNTTSIYTRFEGEVQDIDNQLISAKTDIDEYLKDTGNVYQNFADKFHTLRQFFDGDFTTTVLSIAENDSFLSTDDYEKCKTAFAGLRAYTNDVIDYMVGNIKNNKINFIFTENFYNQIHKTLTNLSDNSPNDKDLEKFSAKMVIDRYNTFKQSYNLTKLDNEISKLETITIDSSALTSLLDTYYYSNIIETVSETDTDYTRTGKLQSLYNDVISYYFDDSTHIDTADDVIVAEMKERIAKYYDYVQICKALISNNFELLRIGNKTDDEIVNYIGFSGVSIYNLKKEITVSKYYFDNETFGYEYLTAFNFNTNSGVETNAFDFAVYAMQILSMFITIFVIFFATSTLSGEQSSGTLKMTATRPFTRNKIFSGKFLACFNVALILSAVSLVASVAVGIAFYGFTMQDVLVVMNADSLFVTNPIVLLLIYFASLLVDYIFYIALAIFISMIFKQTTVSTGITSAIYIVSSVMMGTVTASWVRFVPSLNLGLFRYFTLSNTGMFSFSVVPNTSLLTCGIFTIFFIILFDVFARFLFTHRSLDK